MPKSKGGNRKRTFQNTKLQGPPESANANVDVMKIISLTNISVNRWSGNCNVCGLSHTTEECFIIKNGVQILDSKILKRVFLSLPQSLEWKHKNKNYEIISKNGFSKGIQFGPLEAPRTSKFNPKCSYMLRVFEDKGKLSFLDTTDQDKCNWMTLVQFTTDEKKINCICYQLKLDIYFSILTDIKAGQPLRVGYSPGYKLQLEKFESQLQTVNVKPKIKQENLIIADEDCEDSKKNVEGRNENQEYRDHDYITPSLKKNENGSEPEIKILYPLGERTGLRKRKVNKPIKHEDYEMWKPNIPEDIKNNDATDHSEDDLMDHSKPTLKKIRSKRVQAIRALDKWICKFCHETVKTVESFASHLSHHYKTCKAGKSEAKIDEMPLTNNLSPNKELEETEITEKSKESDDDVKLPVEPTYPFTCDICVNPKIFNRIEYIIRHLTNHLVELNSSNKIQQLNYNSIEESDNLQVEVQPSRSCSYCNRTFFSDSRLQHHLQVNHGKFSKCKRCRRIFNSDEDLKFHVCKHLKTRTDDEVVALLKCEVCDETFSRTSLFEKHVSNHDPTVFICSICNKFVTNETRKLHFLLCDTVHKFESLECVELICPCLKCEKTYQGLQDFQDHVASHTHPLMCQTCKMRFRNNDDIQLHICGSLSCDDCDKTFSTIESLTVHIKEVHQTSQSYCFECVVPFVTKNGYERHADCEFQHELLLKQIDPSNNEVECNNEVGLFICEICGATYNKWSSMKTHRGTHGPRKYTCHLCCKSFTRKELLTDHILIHDEPKFKCNHCEKMFKAKKSLEVHLRIHNGVKPYVCATCGKGFTQRINLRTHETTHLPLELKGFNCPYDDCDKKFATKEYLKFHIEGHQNGKCYACDVCGKNFVRMHMINHHKRSAHGNHKFKCEFCEPPLYLRQKHSLVRHLRKRHENFRETWDQEGYAEKFLIPGDGTFNHPSAKSRMTKVSLKPEESLNQKMEDDGNTILNHSEGMTVMISGSIHDIEGDIEVDTEEVIIGPDRSNEVELVELSEVHHHDNQTSMVLLQLDNSGGYVIAFPSTVEESVELIGMEQ